MSPGVNDFNVYLNELENANEEQLKEEEDV